MQHVSVLETMLIWIPRIFCNRIFFSHIVQRLPLTLAVTIFNALIKEEGSKRGRDPENLVYVQRSAGALCKCIKAQRPWPLSNSSPRGGPNEDLPIHSSMLSSILWTSTMCKALCGVQVLQRKVKFSLQGAHRLERETYELILQYQMEPVI